MKIINNKFNSYLNGAFGRFKARGRGFKYLMRNLLATRGMSPLKEKEEQGYCLGGLKAEQIAEFNELYALVRNNKPLNFWRKVLLKYRGDVLCGIMMNKERKIIGFQLHSFLKKEIKQKIIHAEYSGVHPALQGQGLIRVLRRHTANHFANQGLQGISSTIRQTNHASLKAASHLGYRPTSIEADSKGFLSFYLDLNSFLDDR